MYGNNWPGFAQPEVMEGFQEVAEKLTDRWERQASRGTNGLLRVPKALVSSLRQALNNQSMDADCVPDPCPEQQTA